MRTRPMTRKWTSMIDEEIAVAVGAMVVGEVDEYTRTDFERHNLVRYAGTSGDFNPIHYDEPYAIDAGNPSVFAQGMLTVGIASTVVIDWFCVGTVRSFGTRFRARIFLGDTVTVHTAVTAISTGGDGPTATLNIEVVT